MNHLPDSYHHIYQKISTQGSIARADLAAYLQLILDDVSEPAILHLHTRTDRLAYAVERLQMDPDHMAVVYEAHQRSYDEAHPWSEDDESLMHCALRLLLCAAGVRIEESPATILTEGLRYLHDRADTRATLPYVEALLLEVDKDREVIIAKDLLTNERLILSSDALHQGVSQVLPILGDMVPLPLRANLLNLRVLADDHHVVESIVLDPDFLVDATTIAGSFTHAEVYPDRFILQMLTPQSVSKYIVVGQVINEVLDRLLTNREVSLKRSMEAAFQSYALSLSTMSDDDVRFIVTAVDVMIRHLYQDVKMLRSSLPSSDCYVEPTFISHAYGIQGRLDALFLSNEGEDRREVNIIELKTGKVYMPNEAGLNREHHTQATIYDMLVRDAYDETQDIKSAILYAKEPHARLRSAPPTQQQRRAILDMRNAIVARTHRIMNSKRDDDLSWMGLAGFERSTGFIKNDAQQLQSLVRSLRPHETVLFTKLVASLVRDQYRAKVGAGHDGGRAGFATLWRARREDKQQHYRLLEGLHYEETEGEQHTFSIQHSGVTNFNQGDIIILYPSARSSPLRGQLLKGVITEIAQDRVVVRLRNALVRVSDLAQHGPWSAEPDHIDASLRRAVGGVVRFFRMSSVHRALFMGARAPLMGEAVSLGSYGEGLTAHQSATVSAMLAAEHYYLLWGPPGTGKTSRILKTFVEVSYHTTSDRLLLAAYTNRAVDEICAKLADADIPFVRIGSSHSTAPRFKAHLLRAQLSEIKRRSDVKKLLDQTRIVVGTVASLLGREDLFHLMTFDRLVIDEASQLLEPMAMGLIAHVPRAILIGDHKQLPAISLVEDEYAEIEDDKLQKLGYADVRLSMFERLYHHAIGKGWEHAIGRLHEQGRMHEKIANVASDLFYEHGLSVIPAASVQTRLFGEGVTAFDHVPTYQGVELDERLVAVDVPSMRRDEVTISKENDAEASTVISLLEVLYADLREGMDIGVICPFRAQIVRIRHGLDTMKTMAGWRERITIDTVERYQGSERSIILFNTCAGNEQTLNLITSMDSGGVDRKLNVALTRSKYHFILVGDLTLLRKSAPYGRLMDASRVVVADQRQVV